MQTDAIAGVIEDLVETLEDGRKGFQKAGELLSESGHKDLADQMRQFASQRAQFGAELRELARSKGWDIAEEGSAGAAMHRAWMSLRDMVSGDDAHGVLAAAEQGEDHAVEEFEDALSRDDLPAEVRSVVSRQAQEVQAAHDKVRSLRDSRAA
jgi:uncharacterized protein (TIGR02284 family)